MYKYGYVVHVYTSVLSFAKGVSEQSVNKMCVVQDDKVCTLATFSVDGLLELYY